MLSSSKSSAFLLTTHSAPTTTQNGQFLRNAFLFILGGMLLYCTYAILINDILLLAQGTRSGSGIATSECDKLTTTVPQYFQTSPELWAGPTATGRAPFLAQTNPVSFDPTATFVPNAPLETAMPIMGGNNQNQSIFHHMGQLSPYFPNPVGFGAREYPLPPGANITHVQV
jgi:hypothetical protein